MTAQGHPYTRFRRALVTGSPMLAWTAAAEMGHVSIEDAFALCLLLADRDPNRYPRSAARWLGRYCTESRGVTLDEAMLVAALLAALPGEDRDQAADHLATIGERRGWRRLGEEVRRWQVERQKSR